MGNQSLKSRLQILLCALIVFGAAGLPRALGAPSSKPMSKSEAIGLLRGGVLPSRVADLARQNGIDFQVTPATESELRQAGANDELVEALRELAPKDEDIQIEVTPGDAEVYVDDARAGRTSSEGRLKIPKLSPGQHRIRVSLDGYRDFEKTVEVQGGGIINISTQLQKLGAEAQPNIPPPAPSNGNYRALLDKVVQAFGGRAKINQLRSFRASLTLTTFPPQGRLVGNAELILDFTGRTWLRYTNAGGFLIMVATPTEGYITSVAGTQDMPPAQKLETVKNVWRNFYFVAQHTNDPAFNFAQGESAMVNGAELETLDVSGLGTQTRWFINPGTGRIVRASWMDAQAGSPIEVVAEYSDWRSVGGITYPFKQTSTALGQKQVEIEYTAIEANPGIDPGIFVRPAT